MLDINVENALIILKKYLGNTNPKKYEHSIRVAKTCKMLADKWNISTSDAIIAGLLHDIGKSLSKMQMLELCSRNGTTLYDFEIFDNLTALHGKVGALIFEKEFNKTDITRFNAISKAISSHVTCSENMTDLEKVVFIADNIEPKRKNNLLSKIQSGKINNPNECIVKIIKNKIKKANKKKREPNPLLNATLESIDNER